MHDMLVKRLPNLTYLHFDCSVQHSVLWNIWPLLQYGRWPCLKDLRFSAPGNAGIVADSADIRIWDDFLRFHAPNLENLEFTGFSYNSHLSTRNLPVEFPNLVSFRGRMQQILDCDMLPNVTRLVLTNWWSPRSFMRGLSVFPHLRTLSVAVNLQDTGDGQEIIQSILESCKSLEHLDVFCSGQMSIVSHLSSIVHQVSNVHNRKSSRSTSSNTPHLTQ